MSWRNVYLRMLMDAANDDSAGGGGGGGGSSGKTFTQEELDKIINQRLGKLKGENEKLAKQLTEMGEKLSSYDEMRKQFEELQHEKATAGKNDHEKQALEFKRQFERETAARTKAEQALADAQKAREAAEAQLRDHVVHSALTDALVQHKALPTALKQAVKLMASEAGARLEDGKLVLTLPSGNQTIDYVDDPKGAAAVWLKSNPHFLTHPGGGAGTQNDNGGGGPSFKPGELPSDVESLVKIGFDTPVNGRR